MKDKEKQIEELKVHIERAYDAGLSKEHTQVKRWWKELYELERKADWRNEQRW